MKNKDYFIKQTAEQMELPLELVNAVISFQGEDAARAAHIYNEIEFSGFGKFLLSQHRLKKNIERAEGNLLEGKYKDEEEHKAYIQALKNRIR